jgi:hypothetical protein
MIQRSNYEKGGRQIIHKVKMTEEEEKLLQVRANAAGVSAARFLRDSALGKNRNMSRKMLVHELIEVRKTVDLKMEPSLIRDQIFGALDKFNDH